MNHTIIIKPNIIQKNIRITYTVDINRLCYPGPSRIWDPLAISSIEYV